MNTAPEDAHRRPAGPGRRRFRARRSDETPNARRYRRATLTTGRVEVILAIAVAAVLLAGLALVILPSPLSRVVAAAVMIIGFLVAFADQAHEDRAGR